MDEIIKFWVKYVTRLYRTTFVKCQIWLFSKSVKLDSFQKPSNLTVFKYLDNFRVSSLTIFECQIWQFSKCSILDRIWDLFTASCRFIDESHPPRIFFLTLPNRPLAFDASIFRRIIQQASAFFYARSSNIHLDHDKSFTTRIVIMIFSLRKIFYGLVASADNYFCPRNARGLREPG